MRMSDWSSDVCSSDLYPDAGDGEVLKRVELANAMMFALRGVPAIYSGDEQGFVGDGNDRDAREDMFASKVASYNDNRLLGTDTTTATDHYGHANPLFRQIVALSAVRRYAERRGGKGCGSH